MVFIVRKAGHAAWSQLRFKMSTFTCRQTQEGHVPGSLHWLLYTGCLRDFAFYIFQLQIVLFIIVCGRAICVSMDMHVPYTLHVWRSEHSFQEAVLSFYDVVQEPDSICQAQGASALNH